MCFVDERAVQALDAVTLLGKALREQDAAKAAFDALVAASATSELPTRTVIGESKEYLSLKAADVAVTLAMANVVALARRTDES